MQPRISWRPRAHSPTFKDARSDARSDQMMTPLSLLDTPQLDGWASQWDRLVDSSPLPSPFMRSWWLATTRWVRPPLLADRRRRDAPRGPRPGGASLDGNHPNDGARVGFRSSRPARRSGPRGRGDRAPRGLAPSSWCASVGPQRHSGGSQLIKALPLAVFAASRWPWRRSRRCPTAPRPTGWHCPPSSAGISVAPPTASAPKACCIGQSEDTLSSRRWKRCASSTDARRERTPNSCPNFDRFVAACASGAAADEVVVHELVRGDSVVATVMAFEVAGRVSLYQSARLTDPRWRDATTALLATIIGDACDRGFSEVDFLRGEEPYKGRFAPDRRELSRLVASTGFVGGLGRVSLVAHAHAKATARTVHSLRAIRCCPVENLGHLGKSGPTRREGRLSGASAEGRHSRTESLRTRDQWPRPWLCRPRLSSRVLVGAGGGAVDVS